MPLLSQTSLSTLLEYVNHIHAKTPELLVKKDVTQTELILNALSCLVEETGELSSDIRKLTKLSFNQNKCDAFDPKNLEEECADVLITLLLVVKSLGIDNLDEVIARKIEKNKSRGY